MHNHTSRWWRILLLLVGASIITLTMLELQHVYGQAAAPETSAVQQVLDDQVAAWNRGDLEGFMTGYWRSPNLTFFSGKDQKRGWQETMQRYRERYQGEGREMGKVSFKDVQIEVLSPDHAWVRGQWQVTTSKETLGGLFTLILKKMPEGWRIVHDHTSGG